MTQSSDGTLCFVLVVLHDSPTGIKVDSQWTIFEIAQTYISSVLIVYHLWVPGDTIPSSRVTSW